MAFVDGLSFLVNIFNISTRAIRRFELKFYVRHQARGYKAFFMLNSTGIAIAHN